MGEQAIALKRRGELMSFDVGRTTTDRSLNGLPFTEYTRSVRGISALRAASIGARACSWSLIHLLITLFCWIELRANPAEGLPESDHFYVMASYQHAANTLAAHNMTWKEGRIELGSKKAFKYRYCISYGYWERYDKHDYLISTGGQYFIGRQRYIVTELSFGPDNDFIYLFRFALEYSQIIFWHTLGHIGGDYCDYSRDDLRMLELGITHYYLKSSFHFRVFIADVTGREGSLSYLFEWRNNFHRKSWFILGTAYGSRFVDIVPSFRPSDQDAFAAYFNIERHMKSNLILGTNVTFLKETPDFEMLRGGLYTLFTF
jgi:YaiO family outer membrane protein